MKTISFDFDNTLWDEDGQIFIQETVDILRGHIDNGHRVIITTSREFRWEEETRNLIQKHLGLNLEVFCAPGNVCDHLDNDRCKSDVLIEQNAVSHMDDIPNCPSLMRAKNSGIEILTPPKREIVVARMY